MKDIEYKYFELSNRMFIYNAVGIGMSHVIVYVSFTRKNSVKPISS